MEEELTEEELAFQLEQEAQERRVAELVIKLSGMGNEDIAKHLLNKSLIKLAILLEEDMATAADFNVIRSILKDNNVGIVPTRTNAAGRIQAKLKERSDVNQGLTGIIPIEQLDKFDIADFTDKVQ